MSVKVAAGLVVLAGPIETPVTTLREFGVKQVTGYKKHSNTIVPAPLLPPRSITPGQPTPPSLPRRVV